MAAGIRYEMLHRLLVAPLYRILPPSPIPLVLITYLPGLGHPKLVLTLYLSLSDLSDKRAPRTPDGYHYVVRF